MVQEALSERAHLINIAPHLSYPLPIMLPLYKLVYLQDNYDKFDYIALFIR